MCPISKITKKYYITPLQYSIILYLLTFGYSKYSTIASDLCQLYNILS